MYRRIKKITDFFNKECKDSQIKIKPELIKKYNIFKNWLINNGAIFSKNIDFPYSYGPFNLIGCKSISEIEENESILLIPKKLMIISRELHYLDDFIDSIEEELFESHDIPTLYLTLNLYLENKKVNSFYRPYLDLILSNHNFLNDFTEENLKYFDDDENIIESINNTLYDINELYNVIKRSKNNDFKEMTKDEFFLSYSQVISRQFYIDEKCVALIPLADLLNHKNILVHYEFYDSENYIFKYSSHYSLDLDINIDIRPTFIKEYPVINLKEPNIEVIKHSKDKKTVEIKENDFFSISTSKGEIIRKGDQVFNNYFNGGNKYLLKNYGFCLIDNKFDYTNVIIDIETGKDIYLHKYLEILFGKKYRIHSDSFKKYLKIKIGFNDVCFYLIKYFRFMYFYKEKNDMKQYINYKLDFNLEISFISSSLELLKLNLNLMSKKNKVEDELNELENELFNKNVKELNSFKINAYIYRIKQKINILNQIKLLEILLIIMKKYKKEIKSYIDLMNYEKEFNNISQYDTDENSKIKIINFIKKSKNIIG